MYVCKHKSKILQCKHCKIQCCVGCIQPETHLCPMLHARLLSAREELIKSLPKIVAPKITPI